MACSDNYIHFVCEQLAITGEVRAKKMFGDWLIYIDEKPVVLACDNQCYVKMLPEIEALMDGALTAPPYPGAKPHYLLDIEQRSEAIKVVETLLPLIPYPKPHQKKQFNISPCNHPQSTAKETPVAFDALLYDHQK